MDLRALLNLALEASRAGADEALSLRPDGLPLIRSGGRYLTKADLMSESAVLEVLGRGLDSFGVLSEEGGGGPPEKDAPFWIVDPLDGTWNYHHGGSWWSVSVALISKDRPLLGVVHSPERGRTYSVHEGMGRPECNGQPIGPDLSPFPGEWSISFGAPSIDKERAKSIEDRLFSDLPTLDPKRPLRPSKFLPGRGSMALELCALAEGRLNALVRFHQMCWDVAAGLLIADTAGCALEAYDGGSWREKVGSYSRDLPLDIIGASSNGNLATLRCIVDGSLASWPPS